MTISNWFYNKVVGPRTSVKTISNIFTKALEKYNRYMQYQEERIIKINETLERLKLDREVSESELTKAENIQRNIEKLSEE